MSGTFHSFHCTSRYYWILDWALIPQSKTFLGFGRKVNLGHSGCILEVRCWQNFVRRFLAWIRLLEWIRVAWSILNQKSHLFIFRKFFLSPKIWWNDSPIQKMSSSSSLGNSIFESFFLRKSAWKVLFTKCWQNQSFRKLWKLITKRYSKLNVWRILNKN